MPYLVARGDTPVLANPVPRGLIDVARQGGSRRSRTAPLVRVPRTLPRTAYRRPTSGRLLAAPRTDRDRAMVLAMLLAGLRRCEVLVSAKLDALYGQPPELPADYETIGMARLRREGSRPHATSMAARRKVPSDLAWTVPTTRSISAASTTTNSTRHWSGTSRTAARSAALLAERPAMAVAGPPAALTPPRFAPGRESRALTSRSAAAYLPMSWRSTRRRRKLIGCRPGHALCHVGACQRTSGGSAQGCRTVAFTLMDIVYGLRGRPLPQASVGDVAAAIGAGMGR